MTDFTQDLTNKITAICPIWGVSIGDANDKNTWRIDYQDTANIDQKAAAVAIITSYDKDAVMASIEQKTSIQTALDKSDLVATRCFKAAVAFPKEWQDYVAALRSGNLPTQPSYPAGT